MRSLIFLIMFMSGLANAQIPPTLSYQGVLTNSEGEAIADGSHEMVFRLYIVPQNGSVLWEEMQTVKTAAGLFNAVLGAVNPLNLPFDRTYFLGISVDGGDELSPTIELTSAAYSLNARSVADSAVTGAAIANGSVVRSLNSLTEDVNLVAGDNVTVTSSGNTVVISTTEARLALPFGGQVDEPTVAFSIVNDGVGSAAFFQIFNENSKAPVLDVTQRGGGVAGVFSVIKSDNPRPALNVETNGTGMAGFFEIINSSNNKPVITASTNGLGPAVSAKILAVANTQPALEVSTAGQGPAISVKHEGSAGNLAEFKTLSGQQVTISRDGNIIAAGDLKIGGKIIFADDTEQSTAASTNGASGWLLTGNTGIDTSNFIGTLDNLPFEIKVNNARGFRLEPAVSGTFFSPNVIGGFAGNQVINGAIGATISGGGFVGGGAVGFSAHEISADFGAVGGGTRNIISAYAGTISGGIANTVSGQSAVIGGGSFNQALSDRATVAGGQDNIASGGQSFIGGGRQNLASGQFSTIAGGNENHANGIASAIGGGEGNQAAAGIVGSADYGVIGGGKQNLVFGRFGTVSGGSSNTTSGEFGAIGGGENNEASVDYATVSGGSANKAVNFYATVSGGESNIAFKSHGTIAGGQNNSTEAGFATVSGGQSNKALGGHATVGGGDLNKASGSHATVGGGDDNVASGQAATVPGGDTNHARGDYSFAAGYKARAIHEGSFVWNDRSVTTGNDSLVTTADNQFLIRAAGGVGIGTTSPGFPLEMGSGAHVTTGGVWSNASSRAYKERITNLSAEEALSAFQNLNPVKYNYKNETDEEYVGFIAEDVPELVATKDRKSLSPMDIVAIMTKVVQQQQAVISQLQVRMAELENRE